MNTFDWSSFLLGIIVFLIILIAVVEVAYVMIKAQIRKEAEENDPDVFDIDRENVRNLMGDNTK